MKGYLKVKSWLCSVFLLNSLKIQGNKTFLDLLVHDKQAKILKWPAAIRHAEVLRHYSTSEVLVLFKILCLISNLLLLFVWDWREVT